MTHGSRADGMLCSCLEVNVCLVPVSLVSTIGLSPLTVTVSCTVETPSCVLDVGAEADRDRDAFLDDRLESRQLELDRVSADASRGNRNVPVSLVIAVSG